ncbi:DUF6248 family natural product biosynthesis protein [Streptosporangium sp. NBC_01755]|uniref:DUF6248 family natural product biosynthesis protein n=1 Tax=Streptosporangium sp. NBC_01755 TaxID=2975949 RepID=UPI002DD8E64F|nr:DUF6248 family natural product biosynthesis protein [Streptosporangium sp. NBC_01755]WSC98436.1 DUF6248 family natural product biosynthesis protein [Streptosporangium sp. NBC_01755]
MTKEDAEWVREHVWTQGMRKIFKEVPGYYLVCACQSSGPCHNSKDPGRHQRCHVGQHPLISYETIIGAPGGTHGVAFATPYRYPTASATGWKYSTAAMVWLADRRCAWWCRCDCGHPRADIAHAPEKNPMRPVRYKPVFLPDFNDPLERQSA